MTLNYATLPMGIINNNRTADVGFNNQFAASSDRHHHHHHHPLNIDPARDQDLEDVMEP